MSRRPALELRRQQVTAQLLDPRRGFERTEMPLEIRWDPLTGQSCRLLPEGSLQAPEAQDLDALAEQSRPTCPFCAKRIESLTPRFPPEVWPEGRIRVGEALLFPNLVPYSKWSSVSDYSPEHHLLRLDQLTPAMIGDNLMAQVTFAQAVLRHDPSSRWVSVNANQLPPSGSSIFHPHLQGAANPVPTTIQRLLEEHGAAGLREYLELEQRDGERADRVDRPRRLARGVRTGRTRRDQSRCPRRRLARRARRAGDRGARGRHLAHPPPLCGARLSELQPRPRRDGGARDRLAAPPASRRTRVSRALASLGRDVERAAALGGGDRSGARARRRARTRALRLSASADDHHRTRRVLGHTVGGGTKKMIPQEVPAVTEDDEVEATGRRELRDHLRRMAGLNLDGELEPELLRLLVCPPGQAAEEAVLLELDLVDLADGGRVRRQRSLDR